METIDVTNYQDEYMSIDYADVLDEMLKKYNDDELTELLCECETILQTNDIYLNKINERGCKRFFNLITGIEGKCKRRLRDNFQVIHKITIEVEKKILLRVKDLARLINKLDKKCEKENIFTQQCISFLLQKAIDHKKLLKEFDERMDINDWVTFNLDEYELYSDTRKILQITSDVYLITKGKCEIEPSRLKKAIKELKLLNVEISPDDFAKEIMQESKLLPLYIKDELNYNNTQVEISNYGALICQVYNLTIDPNIHELSVARGEEQDTLCMPLIEKLIKDNDIDSESALQICQKLLNDMYSINEEKRKIEEMEKQERIKAEKQKEAERIKEENDKRQNEENQRELEQKYSLSVVSPVNLIECSLDNYKEKFFKPTYDFGIEKGSMKDIQERLSSFSPNIIVKSDGISEEKLGVEKDKVHIISLADFYFCLWNNKKQGQDEKLKYVVLIDYYEHDLYVSCYGLDYVEEFNKEKTFTIKYNKARKNIMKAIKTQKFLADIPEEEIALYRIFESEKFINVKLEKLEIPFIGNLLRAEDSLKTPESRKEVIDSLYEFEKSTLLPKE